MPNTVLSFFVQVRGSRDDYSYHSDNRCLFRLYCLHQLHIMFNVLDTALMSLPCCGDVVANPGRKSDSQSKLLSDMRQNMCYLSEGFTKIEEGQSALMNKIADAVKSNQG